MTLAVEGMVRVSGNDFDRSRGSTRVVGGRRRLWWMETRGRRANRTANEESRVGNASSRSPEPSLISHSLSTT
jgi:hypothetical protein